MKKVMIALAAGVVLFASCKKDYTCTCTSGGVSSTVTYEGLSKSQANATELTCTLASTCVWATK